MITLLIWANCGMWWVAGWSDNATSLQKSRLRFIDTLYAAVLGPLVQFRKVFQ